MNLLKETSSNITSNISCHTQDRYCIGHLLNKEVPISLGVTEKNKMTLKSFEMAKHTPLLVEHNTERKQGQHEHEVDLYHPTL